MPLTDASCQAAGRGWRLDKGNGWWDGDYRSTIYNHYLTPNSKQYDCLSPFVPHNPGWRAARSFHPGGVNTLFCDGHVQFIKDSVAPNIWRACPHVREVKRSRATRTEYGSRDLMGEWASGGIARPARPRWV